MTTTAAHQTASEARRIGTKRGATSGQIRATCSCGWAGAWRNTMTVGSDAIAHKQEVGVITPGITEDKMAAMRARFGITRKS